MGEIINHPSAFIGLKQAIATDLQRGIKQLMLSIVNDRILHAETLAMGRDAWRAAFVKDLGPSFGNSRAQADDLANSLFRFFDTYWVNHYGLNVSPKLFLNKVEVKSPPTQEEIDNAWRVDIASSESAMQSMYEGSARVRTGPLETHGAKRKMEKVR